MDRVREEGSESRSEEYSKSYRIVVARARRVLWYGFASLRSLSPVILDSVSEIGQMGITSALTNWASKISPLMTIGTSEYCFFFGPDLYTIYPVVVIALFPFRVS